MEAWECALSFMDSQVLLTAEELGIFSVLDRLPQTATRLASSVELPEDSTQRMLNMLCALGFTERRPDGAYANTREAECKLVRGKPGYIGDLFVHVREELYPLWGHFKESLRANRSLRDELLPRTTEEWSREPDKVEAFMKGMHTITYQTSAEFASMAPEMSDISRIIDVGGAAGSFLIALAERFPRLRGTVLDLDYVQPVAEKHFREFGLEDRLSFHAADFFSQPIPPGADAYALGFILHDWNTEQGDHLLGSIARAASPGAILIIGEYMLDENKTGPKHVVRADLNMMVAARGRERSAREYADWIKRHGFELQSIKTTIEYGRSYLLAVKQ